eukprot:m.92231 g.92231  ORF g.92231 m.92231 type:complete len:294 (+) comp12027_c0_seq1:648-1529(+)
MVSWYTVGLAVLAGAGANGQAPSKDGSYFTLNNGLKFDSASFGLQVYGDDTAKQYTLLAIKAGFRNFFSSVLAGNQNGFGEAVAASPVPRDELFICGSVNTGSGACSGFDDCKTQTAQGCADNLQAIGVKQLDMIMLDYPASDCASIQGQWAAFEEMLGANQTRSLAVSNFDVTQLQCITSNASATVPAVNQLQFSVGTPDPGIVDDAKAGGILVQAYSPLGSGSLPTDPDCVKIGKAHNKSGAQVALRWIVQRNATYSTQASTLAYFQEDVSVFDFELTPTEMATLNNKLVS